MIQNFLSTGKIIIYTIIEKEVQNICLLFLSPEKRWGMDHDELMGVDSLELPGARNIQIREHKEIISHLSL